MPRVTVAIPTFRRPRGLARLLEALARIETTASVQVLVADNDAEKHEGFDLCASLRGYRWPLQAIVVPARGIAQVRNALTDAALNDEAMDFLAMLDDDEWPEPGWLDAFLAEQTRTGAGAVQGSILFEIEGGAKDWSGSFDGMSDIRHASGPVDMLQGAGNLLIARAALDAVASPKFDPAFALTGGEDRDFFLRLKAAGVRFAWSDEAVARGFVPETRTSFRWALARAYSVGNTDMRSFLKYRPSLRACALEAGKIAAALLLSPVLFVILGYDANRRADALRRMARAAGKVTALFGRRYNEYATIHGD
ncbi:MAG: glycosyltransferase family 2 protein [Proteobacteria bacterium]|nr:glycosyltransferase family 2 protein [Pseudomonadota bacterium]